MNVVSISFSSHGTILSVVPHIIGCKLGIELGEEDAEVNDEEDELVEVDVDDEDPAIASDVSPVTVASAVSPFGLIIECLGLSTSLIFELLGLSTSLILIVEFSGLSSSSTCRLPAPIKYFVFVWALVLERLETQ